MSSSDNILFYLGCTAGATFLYAAYTLIKPIVVPPIHTYPWQLPQDGGYAQRQSDKNTTVVIAGSYNPPHRGHLAMITHLAERYGKVLVVVGMNPNKQYAVSPHTRADLLRTMLQSLPNVQVHVVAGYIWRFAKPVQGKIFFRGIRTWEKDGPEERNLQILNTWGPLLLGPLWWPIPTQFLEGKPEFNHISSTLIRDLCTKPGFTIQDVFALVPESIAAEVVKYYGKPDKSSSSGS